MNRAQEIALKNALWAQIKRLGDYWGEDSEFTKDFGKDVYNAYMGDLEAAVACFSELIRQTEGGSKRKTHFMR